MAKKKTHIDKLFKQGLSGSSGNLNGTEWNRLMKELHPPKKKKFLWWWFVLSIVLVGAAYFIYQNGFRLNSNAAPVTNYVKVEQPKNVEKDKKILDEKSINTSKVTAENAIEINPILINNKGANSGNTLNRTMPISKPNIEADSSRKFNYHQFFKFLPKELKGIGSRIEFAIPGLIQLINHPKPNLPAPGETTKVYIGISLSQVLYNQSIKSTNPDYIRLRNSNEKPVMSKSLSFEMGMEWKGFDLQTGLQYFTKGQSLNDHFAYQLYDSFKYIDLQGNVTYIPWNYRDTIINTPTGEDHKFTYVSIPLSIGKSVDLSGKYSLGFGLRTNVQFLANAKGMSLGESLKPLPLNANQFNRLNLTVGGYAEIVREVNMLYDFGLRLNLDQDLNNTWKNSNVTQKFTGYSVGIMVRRKLY